MKVGYNKLLYLVFLLLICGTTYGQKTKEVDSTFNESSRTFLVVPLISNSPVMDTGFGGLGMYFFKIDKDDDESPPSLASLYAIYTTNNSYIFTPFGRFFWNEDKNRASIGIGTLRINNDFTYDDQEMTFDWSTRNYVILLRPNTVERSSVIFIWGYCI